MSTTPGRKSIQNFNDNLTPVRFPDSPRTVKSTNADANVAATKSRLDTIVSVLQSNFTKWQVAQKRGTSICTAIEAIKTRALEGKDALTEATETLYPTELRTHLDKLNVIVTIFEDITKSTKESLRQLVALSKLPGTDDTIFYRTWQIPQYIQFLNEVADNYDQETKMKQFVARELPHCMNRADLIRCTTAWEYPQFVDDWTALMFTFLKEETRSIK